jgi:hypothetical protein
MGSGAIPVASLDGSKDINAAVAAILKDDGRGIGVRARLEHLMEPRFGALLAALMKTIGAREEETDLIVDLGAPTTSPTRILPMGWSLPSTTSVMSRDTDLSCL